MTYVGKGRRIVKAYAVHTLTSYVATIYHTKFTWFAYVWHANHSVMNGIIIMHEHHHEVND